MKALILSLLTAVIFGGAAAVNAQTSKELRLRVGKEKTHAASKIKVKFIIVLEDSRCPEGTNCIWAGNAKIKIEAGKNGKASKTFELNTNMAETSAVFEGYRITLKSLTPYPKADIHIASKDYQAILSIERLTKTAKR